MMNVEEVDEETTRMTERMVVLRVATKHNNIWIRQLEMKRKEICELAGLMKFEEIKNEIVKRKRTSKGGQKDAPTSSPRR